MIGQGWGQRHRPQQAAFMLLLSEALPPLGLLERPGNLTTELWRSRRLRAEREAGLREQSAPKVLRSTRLRAPQNRARGTVRRTPRLLLDRVPKAGSRGLGVYGLGVTWSCEAVGAWELSCDFGRARAGVCGCMHTQRAKPYTPNRP